MTMKNIFIGSVIAASISLTACNSNGVNNAVMDEAALNSAPVPPHRMDHVTQVVVFKTRADLPRYSKIIGHVTALNTNQNGTKANPNAVILELKRQAVLKGGNGIVNIIPGTAQTTADVVVTR
ncbi:MAG: hypothetical protein Q8M40_01485 [Legionella sp.]|nr:hypothetical protein [Legionella sp.]